MRRLFWFCWFALAALSRGTPTNDPDSRLQVADAIVRHGTVDVPNNLEHTVEHGGRRYVVFFPGQTISFLPIAVLTRLAGLALPGLVRVLPLAERFAIASLYVPAIAALCIVGYVRVLHSLHVRLRAATGMGLVTLFATPLCIYSGNGSEEIALAATGVWSLWAILSARDWARQGDMRRATDRFGLAAVLLSVGLIHRGTFIAVVAGLSVFAFGQVRPISGRHWPWPRVFGWMLVSVAIVSIIPAYNFLRFGSPWETGYGQFYRAVGGVIATPLPRGLVGLLFSPGKSAFLYAPLLLVVPVAWLSPIVRGRLRSFGVPLLIITGLHLTIYGRHTFWGGDVGWGVRFHTALYPLLLVPVGVAAASIKWASPVGWLLGSLIGFSVLIQAAGVSLNMGLEWSQHRDYYVKEMIPQQAAWTWRGSQLPLRFANVFAKLSGRRLMPQGDRTNTTSPATTEGASPSVLESWNLFPYRTAGLGERPALRQAMWGLWFVLVGLAITGALRLHWTIRILSVAEAAQSVPSATCPR